MEESCEQQLETARQVLRPSRLHDMQFRFRAKAAMYLSLIYTAPTPEKELDWTESVSNHSEIFEESKKSFVFGAFYHCLQEIGVSLILSIFDRQTDKQTNK